MKKLKLDLDALEVESFHPSSAEDGEGTVHAEQLGPTGWRSCGVRTCLTCQLSCGASCGQLTCGHLTCAATCQGTCLLTCGHPTCGNTCETCITCQASCLQPTCRLTCANSCLTCAASCIPQLCGGPSVFEICP